MALKRSSAIIQIGANVTESAANTFTTGRVDLQLNPLDNEVFVCVSANLDLSAPENINGTNTVCNFSISSTLRTTTGSLADSNVIAHKKTQIQNDGVTAVIDEHIAGEVPATQLEYMYIISTNDFFLNIAGQNNVGTMTGICRIYGYRAKADAATYAALVQSELLSA